MLLSCAFSSCHGDQGAGGLTFDEESSYEALVNTPSTGVPGETLVIAGEGGRNAPGGGFWTTPDGRRGAMLRAYDKATGDNVAEVYMPAPQTGTPMTYELDGKQYIVVAVGGGTVPAELLAFALPD